MTPTGKEVRATVLKNYEHIEADLKIAEVNLPDPGKLQILAKLQNQPQKLFMPTYA